MKQELVKQMLKEIDPVRKVNANIRENKTLALLEHMSKIYIEGEK